MAVLIPATMSHLDRDQMSLRRRCGEVQRGSELRERAKEGRGEKGDVERELRCLHSDRYTTPPIHRAQTVDKKF